MNSRVCLALSSLLLVPFACGGRVSPELDIGPIADAAPVGKPIASRDGGASRDSGAADGSVIAEPATAPLIIVDLPPAQPGELMTFQVPKGVVGIHIVGQASSIESVDRIRAPSGVLVHANARPIPADHEVTISFTGEVAAAGVPMARQPETMPVAPGEWAVGFGGPSTVKSRVYMQNTPDGQPHGGLLDINVFLPPGLQIDGEALAAAPARWRGLQERISTFYSAAFSLYGLSRGNVVYYKFPSRYDVLDDDNLLFEAFAATKMASSARALNVVLSNAGTQNWWGIAGGIPGAALTPGTDASAVALALIEGAGADEEGAVLAHEAGHFFGLSHLTEFDDRGNDPLEDTGQCPGISSGNFGDCPDADNIMAAAGAVFDPVASPLQKRVVQGSPIYRAFLVDQPPKSIRPPFRADFRRLFGRGVATALRPGERIVLAHQCGVHASKQALSAANRAAVLAVAADPAVAVGIRKFARSVAAR